MNIALWILQALLAFLFLFWGFIIATQPKEKQIEHGPWVADFSVGQLRTTGILQFLGGLGLVLPAITGILPWFTPLAAVGLGLTMVGAMLVQFRRKDEGAIVLISVILLAVLFVIYGRFFAVPLS